jgi:hypothetical protein
LPYFASSVSGWCGASPRSKRKALRLPRIDHSVIALAPLHLHHGK